MYFPVSGLLIFLCLVLGLTVSLVWGQTPTGFRIGSTTVFAGSTIPMTNVGADGDQQGVGLSSLVCTIASPGTAVWLTPDGTVVPLQTDTQTSFTAPPNTIQRRDQESFLTLHRGEGFISPAGQYCCGSATNVNQRLCVTLASCPLLALGNGVVTYTDPLVDNAYDSFTATHTCTSDGYQLVGDSIRICDISGGTGTWRGAERTCNPVDCGTPPVLANGSPGSPDMTTLGGMVTYTCDSGYTLSGSATVTCLASGSWSTRPTCTATCDDLTPPNNGAITYSTTTSPRPQGTTATNHCNTGYELSGGTARTCQSTRTWSGGSITCQPVDCGPPPSITNGSPGTPTSTTFGGTVTYTCIDMYILSGTGPFMCLASKMWDTPPICLATCADLFLENGAITYSPDSPPRRDGVIATHVCDSGYQRSGGEFRICQSDRTWSGVVITCLAICADLPPPENGTITYFPSTTPRREGHIAAHACDSGYQRSAGEDRTCQSDTTWSGADVTCLAICLDLPPLTNGESINYSPSTTSRLEGATATYSCTDGYRLSIDITRTCEDSVTGGRWNGMEPTCLVIPLSFGGSFFFNNSLLTSSDIGEGLSALTCRTELASCCRDEDNVNGGPQGEWYGPDGNKIPSVAKFGIVPGGYYTTRGQSVVMLNYKVNTSITHLTGVFCCVVPNINRQTETFCVQIEANTQPDVSNVSAGVGGAVAVAVVFIVYILISVIVVTCLVVRHRKLEEQLNEARSRALNQSPNDNPTNNPEQQAQHYEDVSKLQVGDTYEQIDPPQSLPLNYEYSQCPAYATSSVSRQRGATQVTQVDEIYEN